MRARSWSACSTRCASRRSASCWRRCSARWSASARLSRNWLLSRTATGYVEAPAQRAAAAAAVPLLRPDQRGLPGPRQAMQPLPGVFLSNRGLAFPGAGAPCHAFLDGSARSSLGLVLAWAAARWAAPRQDAHRPAVPGVDGHRRARARPAARGVPCGGRAGVAEHARSCRASTSPAAPCSARVRRAAGRPDALHRGLHRRDRALRHPGGGPGPDRGGHALGLPPRPGDAAGAPAAGAARHRAADDQPVS